MLKTTNVNTINQLKILNLNHISNKFHSWGQPALFTTNSRTKSFRVLHKIHSWVQPTGFDTKIKIHSCIAKESVPLIVRNKNVVTWYTCGPTVYDSAHVGHASCYMKLDIMQSILRNYFNLNLITVMNITDVDDKIIRRSFVKKSSWQELARLYEEEFWSDLSDLGIKKADKIVRVTENMPLILEFINKLVDTGRAYRTQDGSVYFDVSSYDNYGKLHKVSDYSEDTNKFKKSPADFALWKAAKENEPSWTSNYGNGRPGWHIECSALAGTLLGSSIDIHAGGIDLRFPHHENEEAQSCSYFEKSQWINYWIHTGHLQLKDTKMSKSLQNTVSIRDLLNTCNAEVFRMACVMSHYRNHMDFGEELLKTAENQVKMYHNFLNECRLHVEGKIKAKLNHDLLVENLIQTANEVDMALKDDFDTAQCIKSINSLMNNTNKMLRTAGDCSLEGGASLIGILNFVSETLHNFGFNLSEASNYHKETDVAALMDLLVSFRHDLRQMGIARKDGELLKLCDGVRDGVIKCGYGLNDREKVTTWVKLNT